MKVANFFNAETRRTQGAAERNISANLCGLSVSALKGCLLVAILWSAISSSATETISIVISSNAPPRVQFGAQKLVEALTAANLRGAIVSDDTAPGRKIYLNPEHNHKFDREGFQLGTTGRGYPVIESNRQRRGATSDDTNAIHIAHFGTNSQAGDLYILSSDDSGALYGCLELGRRIREAKDLPDSLGFEDGPAMTLRGTCVGMQKTYILPGRKVYEYPYTPELFPWFYDKELWREYLNFLVEQRMNTLYLWNGHPFASLVRLKDYPEAVEVPEETFTRNVEMFRWLATECDRRGIWLVQMFYNIFLPKPLAEKHGIPTQLAAPTPLASDYTRKSIAEFVKQYPNVGLMVCLGEALQGTEHQIDWATNTILPGVLDGMKAVGLKEQPPVVIRTHAMNPEAIMPACFTVYSNLFTETKYNGESLTTYEPRGRAAQTHRNMAKLGPHLVNVHILSNLEPFRYGATEFIRKSILASRDVMHASGLHLYPLAYWNWPYSPDKVEPPLKQWERDWIWFEAWARYAWNPDVNATEDRDYWCRRLSEFYGCDKDTAGQILEAYNLAGEVAPMLIRRFGITEGNRQTLSLGMTLDQLVNPKRYNAIAELWESQAPPGERLDEYVRKEWNKEPHSGETPQSVIDATLDFTHNKMIQRMDLAAPAVTRHRDEFDRLRNDMICIRTLAQFYASKVSAAMNVMRHDFSKDSEDLRRAEEDMAASVSFFRFFVERTRTNYHFANSMQTGHRKIPFPGAANGVGTNYHWSHVLPLYEKELADFRVHVQELKNPPAERKPVAPWPAAKFRLIGTSAESYAVKIGARPFLDREYAINELAPELNGLTGIRFSHEAAKNGRHEPIEFEVTEPVRLLIGYFQNERDIWLQVPNLDFASHADERGGVDTVLRNAAAIDECPNVNVHAFRYGPGRHRLELIGKGSFVVLGVVPQAVKLEKRDVRLGMK